VQAYNFRMCFADTPANRVPFPKPPGYDPRRYELFARLIQARTEKEGRVPELDSVIKIDRLPNGKADINNQGRCPRIISAELELPGGELREEGRDLAGAQELPGGILLLPANDPQVPEPLRQEMNRWGLCKDEFTDTENWPHQIYVREARRMVGEYVVVQKDLQTELTKPDTIGMGSYNSDSHNVQRVVDADGFARNEGDMQVAVKPYQIPYRAMLPRRTETTNLLVPVAFSASHVAYSSLRMEPQYMIIGQAAGMAAKMAIASGRAVQEIDTRALTENLRAAERSWTMSLWPEQGHGNRPQECGRAALRDCEAARPVSSSACAAARRFNGRSGMPQSQLA